MVDTASSHLEFSDFHYISSFRDSSRMEEQHTQDSTKFIRDWARFSRGETEQSPAPVTVKSSHFPNVYFNVEGHAAFFGRVLDPRREIPGYFKVGDKVFIWGHVPIGYNSVIASGDSGLDFLSYESVMAIDPRKWRVPGISRSNWAPPMDAALKCTQTIARIESNHVYLEDRRWGIGSYVFASSCVALSLRHHYDRVAELGTAWPETWSGYVHAE